MCVVALRLFLVPVVGVFVHANSATYAPEICVLWPHFREDQCHIHTTHVNLVSLPYMWPAAHCVRLLQIHMLKQKPKHVPILRSHQRFKRFFAGTTPERLTLLLEAAYDGLPDKERRRKIRSRVDLLAVV